MPKTWPEMTVEEKLEELHRGRQSVVIGLARIIEEMCTIVKRLDEEFAEFRQKQKLPTTPVDGAQQQSTTAAIRPETHDA